MQRKVDTLFDRHHQQVRWSHSLLRGFMKTIDQPLIVVCLHYGYGFYIPPLPMHHQKIRWSHPPLWGFIKTIDWSVECHPNCMHVIIQPLIVVCLHYGYGFYISPFFSSWDSTTHTTTATNKKLAVCQHLPPCLLGLPGSHPLIQSSVQVRQSNQSN